MFQVYESACDFGSGLLQEGLEAKNDTFVGIYSINRAEVKTANDCLNCKKVFAQQKSILFLQLQVLAIVAKFNFILIDSKSHCLSPDALIDSGYKLWKHFAI